MTYEKIEITTLQATAGLFRMSAGVPARIAPERENELIGEVLKYQKWALDLAEGNAQFYAIVPDKKVCLTSSGLAVLWNIAFVAFSIADASTRARQHVQENQKSGIFNSAIFDLTNFWKDEGLGDRIAYAKKLYHVDSPWPSSIPLPPIDSNATDFDKKVTELFLGALSWLMLHEIGHIHLDHEREITLYERVTQEHQADDFATKWILSKAGNGLQKEFRIMAVNVAMAYLLLNHCVKGVGPTHPHSMQRIYRTIDNYEVGDRSVGLESSAYFLKAIFDPSTKQPQPKDAQEAFHWVIERLRKLFPNY